MNACRKEGPRYGVMQIIRGCDDDKVNAALVGCLGRSHILIGRIGALEKPGGSTFACGLGVRGHCTRNNLCLAVEFSGNAMHRSDTCATPTTHNTGTQAAQGLGTSRITHIRGISRHGLAMGYLRIAGRSALAPYL